MLRNPVEMAPALHAEMLLSGHETIQDFRTAWELQHERRQGRRLPAMTWARRRLIYGEVCSLGAQLQRLRAIVPAERILTITLDDMGADPRREYLRALRFLDVKDDGRTAFPIYNRARNLRWPRIAKILFLIVQTKSRLGIDVGFGLWDRVSSVNIVESPRQPLSDETVALLRRYFEPDIRLLSKLLGRDLGHWLMPDVVQSAPAQIFRDTSSGAADPSAHRSGTPRSSLHLTRGAVASVGPAQAWYR
jgi:hypothetical protein